MTNITEQNNCGFFFYLLNFWFIEHNFFNSKTDYFCQYVINFAVHERKVQLKLTVYATEVKEVGSTVHLVELKAHLGLHPSNWILPSHT